MTQNLFNEPDKVAHIFSCPLYHDINSLLDWTYTCNNIFSSDLPYMFNLAIITNTRSVITLFMLIFYFIFLTDRDNRKTNRRSRNWHLNNISCSIDLTVCNYLNTFVWKLIITILVVQQTWKQHKRLTCHATV